MQKVIFVFILTLGLLSCSSDDETTIGNSDLVGQWNWFSTDGGLNNQIRENPESTGKEIELHLNADYSYEVIENGIQVSAGTYELSLKESIYTTGQERFISYSSNYHTQYVVLSGIIKSINSDSLKISDNNMDGIESGFNKNE